MTASDPLNEHIDAGARALGFTLEEAWRPAVRANLEVSLTFARFVDEFPLPDDIEPACVFKA